MRGLVLQGPPGVGTGAVGTSVGCSAACIPSLPCLPQNLRPPQVPVWAWASAWASFSHCQGPQSPNSLHRTPWMIASAHPEQGTTRAVHRATLHITREGGGHWPPLEKILTVSLSTLQASDPDRAPETWRPHLGLPPSWPEEPVGGVEKGGGRRKGEGWGEKGGGGVGNDGRTRKSSRHSCYSPGCQELSAPSV